MFTFENILYSDAKNYFYIIVEDVSEQMEGITYNDTVYCLSVAVTDDGNGQLAAEMTITVPDGSIVEEIVFENTYTPENVPAESTDPTEPSKPAEPSEPTGPDEPIDPDSPATGNPIYIFLCAMSAGLSAMALILLMTWKQKRMGRDA